MGFLFGQSMHAYKIPGADTHTKEWWQILVSRQSDRSPFSGEVIAGD
jgi:hypothetical protein